MKDNFTHKLRTALRTLMIGVSGEKLVKLTKGKLHVGV